MKLLTRFSFIVAWLGLSLQPLLKPLRSHAGVRYERWLGVNFHMAQQSGGMDIEVTLIAVTGAMGGASVTDYPKG